MLLWPHCFCDVSFLLRIVSLVRRGGQGDVEGTGRHCYNQKRSARVRSSCFIRFLIP